MSHNIFKIGNTKPTVLGNLDIQFSDLSDVNLTNIQTDQFLKYNGSEWINTSVSGGGGKIILFGQGESNSYSNSPATTIAVNDTLYAYDTSPINQISGATLNTTNNWLNYITLPAGSYLLCASTAIEFSASGYFSFNFSLTDNTEISHVAYIGENVTSGASGFIQSYYETSSQVNITLDIYSLSNVDSITNQGNIISESTQILIVEL